MKKYWLISLLLPILMYWGCSEDTSAYLPQEKEDVLVDNVTPENGENEGEGDEELPEGQLVIGMHQVKLNVPVGDSIYERKFKYYLPITIDETQPISLIFDFHGSYMYEAGSEAPNPIANLSTSHPLVQHAIKNNCVVCFPAGLNVVTGEDGAVNWQNSAEHLPFVDAMIDYFKGCTPTIDANRIYSTGQSSGAIFSFVLAFERSEVFAAITPRAGQMNISKQDHFPTRAVPIRVFAGIDDKIVSHDGVISNMTAWAEKIGGYFPADMVLSEDSIEIENYKKVDTRIWKGGNADLQIYSLQEEGHGINEYYCMPYMWEFMVEHTLDDKSASLFVTSNMKEFEAKCGQEIIIKFNHTAGATASIENAPKGWDVQLEEKQIVLTAPKDFFSNISRTGSLDLRVEKDGSSKTLSIAYKLLAPKEYFEVGDIYYNENFEPIGVVCWVNDANIKEAAIINFIEIDTQGNYENSYYANGVTILSPDRNDGLKNTTETVQFILDNKIALNKANSALMWAASYTCKGETGWYLPAVDEWAKIYQNLDIINTALESVGARPLRYKKGNDYWSSTVTSENGTRTLHSYDGFLKLDKKATGESYKYARAMKRVSK